MAHLPTGFRYRLAVPMEEHARGGKRITDSSNMISGREVAE